jgi:Fungalysin metallopeptidase (M36)/Calx-beta domain/Fungalysin/Thermolysin Propeptide Motif/FG-GAP-like repeat/FG-GAP repeat
MSTFRKRIRSLTESSVAKNPRSKMPRQPLLQCERLEDRVTPHGGAETIAEYLPPSHFAAIMQGPLSDAPPLQIALDYLSANAAKFGATAADFTGSIVTSQFLDVKTGITHLYLRQTVNGLEVENANMSVAVNWNGRMVSAGGGYVANLASKLPTTVTPISTPLSAIWNAGDALGLTYTQDPVLIASPQGIDYKSVISAPDLSLDAVTAKLHYIPTADGGATLGWKIIARTTDFDHWYNLTVADGTGAMIAQHDWVHDASYNVVAAPAESPQDGGFTILNNPQDTTASPFGWHDTDGVAGAEFTDTRGNNVDAHLDTNADNVADGTRPDGGAALNFSGFTFNPAGEPNTAQNQAMAQLNLFYAINHIHDVQYKYGFDEAAGNFQVNNYGNGGLGGDAVQADAQDGSGTNNANFGTPPDGLAPRMQQYIFDITTPNRDSSLDNGVIYHEFGHGISNRLTGGAANADALQAIQSRGLGEGWSDYFALMLLQRPTDTKDDSYGIGTYVLGQPQTGVGIRTFPYSTDMAINPHTFEDYNTGGFRVHYTGELWCSALWDLNWLLIDKYGYDSNLSTGWAAGPGPSGAGNKLSMALTNEAMKLQPANPSLIEARDAILAANIILNGGADIDEIWAAFARRGLGFYASTSDSNSDTVIVDFNVPPNNVTISPSVTVFEGNTGTTSVQFTVTLAKPSSLTATVGYTTINGSATSGTGDYVSKTGTVTFAPGVTTQTITILVKGDLKNESDESFTVNLSSPVNAIIPPGEESRSITILNDDGPPTLSVSDATVTEGNAGTTNLSFTVSLSTDSGLPITVNYQTQDGTATTFDNDYLAKTGTLVFGPGELSKTVTVSVRGDTRLETDESLSFRILSPTGATIVRALGTGSITNDDSPPPVLVENAEVVEDDLGTKSLVFNVRLSSVSDVTVFANFFTFNGSAIAGSDYQEISGVLTFNPGETFQTVSVAVLGDTLREPSETMQLSVSTTNTAIATGTILNDDPLPVLIATGSMAGTTARVVVLNRDGSTRFVINPFDEFQGGVTVATEDINGDTIPDIVVGAGAGAGPRVSLYDGATGTLIRSFFAFSNSFTGGVTVAAGDVDGDGTADIIVGAGPGAGPHVKVFDGRTGQETASFFAYESGFRGGVTVAAGDVNRDGRAEIVTGMGIGGIPLVKTFRGTDGLELSRFLAYDVRFRGGISVAFGDLDGDGFAEIITGAGATAAPHVKVFRGNDSSELASFYAYDAGFLGGVSVSTADMDGDGYADIITGAGVGAGPHIKVFKGLPPREIRSVFAGDPFNRTGVRVG